MIREDLISDEIDLIPANLPEIFAKVHRNETAGNKGICFCGNTGTGKSRRVRWMSQAFNIRFVSVSSLCRDLMNCQNEYEREELLSCLPPRWDIVPEHYNDLILDDLGSEPEQQNVYGTKYNLIADVIQMRYEKFPKYKTHFTTNLSRQEICSRYGERVFSRMCEMVHFISLAGSDRRIQ